MKDRIQEINLEISKLLKSKTNPKKLESLQAELKDLVTSMRQPPTLFQADKNSERTAKKSNLVDFQKARASKSAEEFTDSIRTGKLYKELKKSK